MLGLQTGCKKQKTAGFTLIEFLIVITVVSVFGSLVLPFGKKVFHRVYVFCDGAMLCCLVTAYTDAVTNGSCLDVTNIKTMKDFAVALARAGGPNEVSAYQSKSRKNAPKKEILIDGNLNVNGDLKEEDFDFIFANPKCSCGNNMPLFYTRGLQSDGTWCKDGVYGDQGGMIIFDDGNIMRTKTVNKDLLQAMRIL